MRPTEVNEPIGRHPTDRKRMVIRPDGRPARTDFEVVARYESVELLRAELHSGRTHQIRVHLQHLGHPVVGDAVYGSGGSRRISGGPRGHPGLEAVGAFHYHAHGLSHHWPPTPQHEIVY